MSIAIQKKRFNTKGSQSYKPTICTQDKQDFLYQQYLKIFNDFETNFQKHFNAGNLSGLRNSLDSFYKSLKNNELLITDLAKHDDSLTKSSKDVFLIQRAGKVVQLLADYLVNKRTAILKAKKTSEVTDRMISENREITMMVIKVLKMFAMINPTFAAILSHWEGFSKAVLQLISLDNKLYFKQVLVILEALIASNSTTITNDMYPVILETLSNMPKKYFARFSRIVALFVLENSEKTDFKELSGDYIENKMIKIQSFLLSIPNLLESYVLTLEHLKEIIQRLSTTTPENIEKTIIYLKESKLIKDSGLNLSFLKPLFENSGMNDNLISEVLNPKFIIKFIVKKSNMTEILFVISNLLAGKRKIDIQNELNQLNFFKRVIDPLFDILFNAELGLETNDDGTGPDSSYNDPLTTTRIQLLRIIINFCDRDSTNNDNKDLLISKEEKDLLYSQFIEKGLVSHNSFIDDIHKDKSSLEAALNEMSFESNSAYGTFFEGKVLIQNAFEKVENKGLLNKIITLLRKFHGNSNYHFWLASCVESFLRGFNYTHQIFVAHSGLLHSLVNQILSGQITKSNNVQISYDLIGEIVKFNRYNIIFLEQLCKQFEWDELLPKKLAQNVVDSNVFVRSMLLSYERIKIMHDNESDPVLRQRTQEFIDSISIFAHLNTATLEWFKLLIETVEPAVINQDNICCINTALIMAMFAEQRGCLQDYLNTLLVAPKNGKKTAKEVIENFDKVLHVWQKYYLSKTKDCFSLQHTTSIKFGYYQDIKRKIQSFLQHNIAQMSQ